LKSLFETFLEGSADSDRAFARRSRFDLRLSLKAAVSSFLLGCRQEMSYEPLKLGGPTPERPAR